MNIVIKKSYNPLVATVRQFTLILFFVYICNAVNEYKVNGNEYLLRFRNLQRFVYLRTDFKNLS